MIRKVVIGMLAAGALACGITSVASLRWLIIVDPDTPHLGIGQGKLFWVRWPWPGVDGQWVIEDPRPWPHAEFCADGELLLLPLWILSLLLVAYPTIAFIRGPVRRWQRLRAGMCVKCGYDLTGNVTGICPECGDQVGAR